MTGTVRAWTARAAMALAGALAGVLPPAAARADEPLETVRFGTNWLAQGEHGGFYQALADGAYARHGLDVEILSGGPRVNMRARLQTGQIDLYMGGNLLPGFSARAQGIPSKIVAAFFQKDPQALLAHPGRYGDMAALGRAPLFLTMHSRQSFFPWLRLRHGFSEENLRPYTFNVAPFIADPAAVQQGYATNEPFQIQREAGFAPDVFLLADHGWASYSTTVEAMEDTLRDRPEMVRRFIAASAEGWRTYLHGDGSAGDAMILRENPEMTQELLDFSRREMIRQGLVDSGDAATGGIGAMTDARFTSFFNDMVAAGVVTADLDYRSAYTLEFLP